MKIIATWVLVALVILTLPSFIPGIEITSFGTAMIVALFFGILNAIVRPIILLIAFPITILTLGLFSFVVNAGLFWSIGSFVKGFYVDGFVPALLGSLVISVTTFIVDKLLGDN
ncbi:MAG: phage holin family protein [Candidatus Pacebacteria bacterium]|jgi:putative membrane protein|nr:phage holin family protein [Candidatus Paceibacterota bacterium]